MNMTKLEIRACAEMFQDMLRGATTEYIELSYCLVFALDWVREQGFTFKWSVEWDEERILAILDRHGSILYHDVTAYDSPETAILTEAMAARTLMGKYDFRNQVEEDGELW